MRRQLLPALIMLALMTVAVGIVYPLVVTGVAQAAFADKANGSLVRGADGTAVGSRLIGQAFGEDRFFWPRPSAAGDGYDASASGASNLGPTNPELLDRVVSAAAAYRAANGLDPDVAVPVDAVTSSASGLDPHISVANARLQAPRVAAARGLPVGDVLRLVDACTDTPTLGFLGSAGVNVLMLNMALDAQD